jgi:hypothetical protein
VHRTGGVVGADWAINRAGVQQSDITVALTDAGRDLLAGAR